MTPTPTQLVCDSLIIDKEVDQKQTWASCVPGTRPGCVFCLLRARVRPGTYTEGVTAPLHLPLPIVSIYPKVKDEG